ncbi:MAG: VTT domain-containing protein [Pseudomonadota bacterium]
MVSLFEKIGHFLNNMDRKAWTSLAVTVGLLAVIAFMLVFGKDWLGLNETAVQNIMTNVAESRFALVGVIAVFCALALTGFPQTFLFAGTVAVFGPVTGALYSWIATICSSTITYTIGHFFGARFVSKLSAGRAQNMIKVAQAHGLLAAMIIRWIPSAPFIVINSIFGAASVALWKFLVGTGVGIIPKILFVSFFTDQIDELLGFFQSRDPRDLVVIAGLVVGWLAFLLFVRWLYTRLRKTTLSGLDEE